MPIFLDKIDLPDSEFTLSFARSSGPGGQNVNKVNSKAVLRWAFAESSLSPAIKGRIRNHCPNRINKDGTMCRIII